MLRNRVDPTPDFAANGPIRATTLFNEEPSHETALSMLTIRQTQKDVLQRELADKNFVKRVIGFLRIECPEDIGRYPEGQWFPMVVNGISRARRYGIAYESSIAAFVALMFQYAPNFDEYAPIQAILTDKGVPPDTRMKLLGECTLDEDWVAVEARYDAAAWDVKFGN